MKRLAMWAAAAAMVVGLGTAVAAQPGMGNLTPQQMATLQAKRKAWEKWRASHKNIQRVGQTFMGIAELDKSPQTRLNKSQAQKVLAVVKPWRNKPVMTDAQAKQVVRQLTAPLTIQQLKKLETAPRQGRGGPGFGGGARSAGAGAGGPRQGGGGGGGRSFDPSRFPDPKEYNPLNPATSPFAKMNPGGGDRFGQRFNQAIATLQVRAK